MNVIIPVQENPGSGGGGGTTIIGNTSIPVTQGGSFQVNVPNGISVLNFPVSQGVTFGGITVPGGITAFQGTSPWVSSIPAGLSVLNFPISQGVTFGSVTVGNTLFVGITGSVPVIQGGSFFVNIGNSLAVTVPSGVSVLNFPTSQGVTFGSVSIGNTLFAVTSVPSGVTVNNFPSTQAVTGPISVLQGGSFNVQQGSSWLVNVPNGITAFQGTSPWSVAQGSSWVVNAAQGGSYAVNVGNTLFNVGSLPGGATVFQGTNPWVSSVPSGVSVLNFPASQGVTFGNVTIGNTLFALVGQNSSFLVNLPNGATVFQGTAPWGVLNQGGSLLAQQGSSWLVNVPNGVTSFQGTNPWVVAQSASLSVFQGGSWTVNVGNTLFNVGSVPGGITTFQGTTNWQVTTKAPLTASGASLFTAGTAAIQIAAANATRGGLLVRNLSSTGIASLTFGTTGVVGVGTVLYPGEPWWMDEYCYTIGSVYLINSVAGGTFSSQEYSE